MNANLGVKELLVCSLRASKGKEKVHLQLLPWNKDNPFGSLRTYPPRTPLED